MTNEIISIKRELIGQELVNSVNARELHQALWIKKDFSDWIKAQIKSLELEENLDYIVFPQKVKNLSGGRPSMEYILTVDAAKHIAMASRTKKGKEVRRYFIEIEKAYKRSLSVEGNRGLEMMSRAIEGMTKSMESMAKSISSMAKGIEMVVYSQREILERLSGVGVANRGGRDFVLERKRMSKDEIREFFKRIIESSPGINQSAILKSIGKKRDDKSCRKILSAGVGESWVFLKDGREKRFYPVKRSVEV